MHPAGPPHSRSRGGASGFVAVLLLALALAHIRYLWFVCDDAYITYRYASNLAHGLGPVWNAGERVEGYTNFLWMLVAAVVARSGGRPEAMMPVLSAACALGTIAAIALGLRRRGSAGSYAAALLATSSGFAAWATGGLGRVRPRRVPEPAAVAVARPYRDRGGARQTLRAQHGRRSLVPGRCAHRGRRRPLRGLRVPDRRRFHAAPPLRRPDPAAARRCRRLGARCARERDAVRSTAARHGTRGGGHAVRRRDRRRVRGARAARVEARAGVLDPRRPGVDRAHAPERRALGPRRAQAARDHAAHRHARDDRGRRHPLRDRALHDRSPGSHGARPVALPRARHAPGGALALSRRRVAGRAPAPDPARSSRGANDHDRSGPGPGSRAALARSLARALRSDRPGPAGKPAALRGLRRAERRPGAGGTGIEAAERDAVSR